MGNGHGSSEPVALQILRPIGLDLDREEELVGEVSTGSASFRITTWPSVHLSLQPHEIGSYFHVKLSASSSAGHSKPTSRTLAEVLVPTWRFRSLRLHTFHLWVGLLRPEELPVVKQGVNGPLAQAEVVYDASVEAAKHLGRPKLCLNVDLGASRHLWEAQVGSRGTSGSITDGFATKDENGLKDVPGPFFVHPAQQFFNQVDDMVDGLHRDFDAQVNELKTRNARLAVFTQELECKLNSYKIAYHSQGKEKMNGFLVSLVTGQWQALQAAILHAWADLARWAAFDQSYNQEHLESLQKVEALQASTLNQAAKVEALHKQKMDKVLSQMRSQDKVLAQATAFHAWHRVASSLREIDRARAETLCVRSKLCLKHNEMMERAVMSMDSQAATIYKMKVFHDWSNMVIICRELEREGALEAKYQADLQRKDAILEVYSRNNASLQEASDLRLCLIGWRYAVDCTCQAKAVQAESTEAQRKHKSMIDKILHCWCDFDKSLILFSTLRFWSEVVAHQKEVDMQVAYLTEESLLHRMHGSRMESVLCRADDKLVLLAVVSRWLCLVVELRCGRKKEYALRVATKKQEVVLSREQSAQVVSIIWRAWNEWQRMVHHERTIHQLERRLAADSMRQNFALGRALATWDTSEKAALVGLILKVWSWRTEKTQEQKNRLLQQNSLVLTVIDHGELSCMSTVVKSWHIIARNSKLEQEVHNKDAYLEKYYSAREKLELLSANRSRLVEETLHIWGQNDNMLQKGTFFNAWANETTKSKEIMASAKILQNVKECSLLEKRELRDRLVEGTLQIWGQNDSMLQKATFLNAWANETTKSKESMASAKTLQNVKECSLEEKRELRDCMSKLLWKLGEKSNENLLLGTTFYGWTMETLQCLKFARDEQAHAQLERHRLAGMYQMERVQAVHLSRMSSSVQAWEGKFVLSNFFSAWNSLIVNLHSAKNMRHFERALEVSIQNWDEFMRYNISVRILQLWARLVAAEHRSQYFEQSEALKKQVYSKIKLQVRRSILLDCALCRWGDSNDSFTLLYAMNTWVGETCTAKLTKARAQQAAQARSKSVLLSESLFAQAQTWHDKICIVAILNSWWSQIRESRTMLAHDHHHRKLYYVILCCLAHWDSSQWLSILSCLVQKWAAHVAFERHCKLQREDSARKLKFEVGHSAQFEGMLLRLNVELSQAWMSRLLHAWSEVAKNVKYDDAVEAALFRAGRVRMRDCKLLGNVLSSWDSEACFFSMYAYMHAWASTVAFDQEVLRQTALLTDMSQKHDLTLSGALQRWDDHRAVLLLYACFHGWFANNINDRKLRHAESLAEVTARADRFRSIHHADVRKLLYQSMLNNESSIMQIFFMEWKKTIQRDRTSKEVEQRLDKLKADHTLILEKAAIYWACDQNSAVLQWAWKLFLDVCITSRLQKLQDANHAWQKSILASKYSTIEGALRLMDDERQESQTQIVFKSWSILAQKHEKNEAMAEVTSKLERLRKMHWFDVRNLLFHLFQFESTLLLHVIWESWWKATLEDRQLRAEAYLALSNSKYSHLMEQITAYWNSIDLSHVLQAAFLTWLTSSEHHRTIKMTQAYAEERERCRASHNCHAAALEIAWRMDDRMCYALCHALLLSWCIVCKSQRGADTFSGLEAANEKLLFACDRRDGHVRKLAATLWAHTGRALIHLCVLCWCKLLVARHHRLEVNDVSQQMRDLRSNSHATLDTALNRWSTDQDCEIKRAMLYQWSLKCLRKGQVAIKDDLAAVGVAHKQNVHNLFSRWATEACIGSLTDSFHRWMQFLRAVRTEKRVAQFILHLDGVVKARDYIAQAVATSNDRHDKVLLLIEVLQAWCRVPASKKQLESQIQVSELYRAGQAWRKVAWREQTTRVILRLDGISSEHRFLLIFKSWHGATLDAAAEAQHAMLTSLAEERERLRTTHKETIARLLVSSIVRDDVSLALTTFTNWRGAAAILVHKKASEAIEQCCGKVILRSTTARDNVVSSWARHKEVYWLHALFLSWLHVVTFQAQSAELDRSKETQESRLKAVQVEMRIPLQHTFDVALATWDKHVNFDTKRNFFWLWCLLLERHVIRGCIREQVNSIFNVWQRAAQLAYLRLAMLGWFLNFCIRAQVNSIFFVRQQTEQHAYLRLALVAWLWDLYEAQRSKAVVMNKSKHRNNDRLLHRGQAIESVLMKWTVDATLMRTMLQWREVLFKGSREVLLSLQSEVGSMVALSKQERQDMQGDIDRTTSKLRDLTEENQQLKLELEKKGSSPEKCKDLQPVVWSRGSGGVVDRVAKKELKESYDVLKESDTAVELFRKLCESHYGSQEVMWESITGLTHLNRSHMSKVEYQTIFERIPLSIDTQDHLWQLLLSLGAGDAKDASMVTFEDFAHRQPSTVMRINLEKARATKESISPKSLSSAPHATKPKERSHRGGAEQNRQSTDVRSREQRAGLKGVVPKTKSASRPSESRGSTPKGTPSESGRGPSPPRRQPVTSPPISASRGSTPQGTPAQSARGRQPVTSPPLRTTSTPDLWHTL